MSKDIQYLELLSGQYPNIESVAREIINLTATLRLPKGTEYFFSDLHGEHEAFIHLLRSASGVIRAKIEMLFANSILQEDRDVLAAVICYPEQQLAQQHRTMDNFDSWCEITIHRIVQVAREVSAKYADVKVKKTIGDRFPYIIAELLHTDGSDEDKKRYYRELISVAVSSGMAEPLIIALCRFIQQMSVDQLHIIGDIFDRGPRADRIMQELMRYHDVDIQWGNHDISWMGAMSGNLVCLMNVLRIAISYNSFDLLEDGYGINLRPLSMFAAEIYKDDPCQRFMPHMLDKNSYDPVDSALAAKLHKAIAVLQFKLEGQLIQRHPEYHMENRLLLDKIDYESGTITIGDQAYPLTDTSFPTIDPANPYALSADEEQITSILDASFRRSELLRTHIDFMFSHGAMYKTANGNLLYHGCIPMTEDGEFDALDLCSGSFRGRALLDHLDKRVRRAYFGTDQNDKDLMWYLWCGAKSPVYGKDKMTSFERYFVDEPKLYKETMNPYYRHYEEENTCRAIMEDFGLDLETGHIINGHVPVKVGETPIKANGRLFVIDGGISKAYQSTTGIAGYTLILNSHNLELAIHKPFHPATEMQIAEMHSTMQVVEVMRHRMTIDDTDEGSKIRDRIAALRELLDNYRSGRIRQKL